MAVAIILCSILALAAAQQNPMMNQIGAANSTSTGAGSTIPGSNMPGLNPPNTIISPTNFQRTNVSLVDPLAVCNDGSPGFYYFRQGTGNGSTKWVIRLEGGGWCSDQQTCTLRGTATPNLMGSSTQYYPDILAGAAVAGILSGDLRANPYMYTWNHVSIGYCSSDSYLGNVGPGDTPEAGVFQFRGQRIVNATISSLLAKSNLGYATDVLIDGVSAGAVGAFSLADGIYSLIKPKAPSLTNFKASIDAGWFLDLASYSQAASAFTFRKTAVGLLDNFKAAYNPTCMAAYASQPWACFFAPYAWAYVMTPLIFHEYLYDSANLGYNAAGSQSNINDFRAKLTASISTPANAIPSVRNQSNPGASTTQRNLNATVSTQSVGSLGPSVTSGRSGVLPTLPPKGAASPGMENRLYAPGMQNLPPTALPQGGPSAPISSPPTPGAAQVSDIRGVPGPSPIGTNTLPAVFSPACNSHDITDNELFAVSHIGNIRFVDVLNTWFATGRGEFPLIDPTPTLATSLACLRAV